MKNRSYKNLLIALSFVLLACPLLSQGTWLADIKNRFASLTWQQSFGSSLLVGGLMLAVYSTVKKIVFNKQKKTASEKVKNRHDILKMRLPNPEPLSTQELEVLKPFASKKEMLDDYSYLLNLDQKLDEDFKVITDFFKESHEEKDEELWLSIFDDKMREQDACCRKTFIFCQRFFRYIVKQHSEEKLKYARELGFKISEDGSLKMERKPPQECTLGGLLAFLALSINPKDKDALFSVKKYIKSRENPSKDATSFFPQIYFRACEGTNGMYVHIENKIYLCKKFRFPLQFRIVIHEFIHRLQFANSCLGYVIGCSPLFTEKVDYSSYPTEFAVEAEADELSLMYHPDPKGIFKLLQEEGQCFDWESCEQFFPNLTDLEMAGFLIEKRGTEIGRVGEQYKTDASNALVSRGENANFRIHDKRYQRSGSRFHVYASMSAREENFKSIEEKLLKMTENKDQLIRETFVSTLKKLQKGEIDIFKLMEQHKLLP